MERLRFKDIALAVILVVPIIYLLALALPFVSWLYTSSQLALARSRGVYPSAEQAMLAKIDQGYGVSRVDILYAGPNSHVGRQPHIWFVVAEVRTDTRCYAPGSYFLHTKEGWVHVPEGALPEFIGFWMGVFGQAGPGQSEPSIDRESSQPVRLCQPN